MMNMYNINGACEDTDSGVCESTEVGFEVEADPEMRPGERDTPDEEDCQHHVGEDGSEVDHLQHQQTQT